MTLMVRAAVWLVMLAGLLGVGAGWTAWVAGQGREQGAASVHAQWERVRAEQYANAAAAEKDARAQEALRARNAERIAHDQALREAALRRRLAHSDAALRSLRDTIAELDAGDTDLPGAPAHAGAAAGAGQAATARELLGACGERYAAVAAEADGLREQVTGLQQFTSRVCVGGMGAGDDL